MTYTVTGIVPTPHYRPLRPVFDHHDSTQPTGKPYPNGEAGRQISMTSESQSVAYEVAAIFAKSGLKNVEVK